MALKDWTDWEPQERAVLVFLRREDQILLIHKKRGLGTGKVNGPGGRIESGETPLQAAIRETREETGIDAADLTPSAELWFQFTSGYSLSAEVFTGRASGGILTSCDEADPFWQNVNQLPWSQMWSDDALWLPHVLNGLYVSARFVFSGETMLEAGVEVRQRPSGSING